MIDGYKCVVCAQPARAEADGHRHDVIHVNCDRCGAFESLWHDGKVAPYMIPDETRHLLPAFLCKRFAETSKPFTIVDRRGHAFPSGFVEPTVTEKFDRTLLLVAARSKAFGAVAAVVPKTDWPWVGVHDDSELNSVLDHLEAEGLLSSVPLPHGNGDFRTEVVSGDGWKQVERLRVAAGSGRRAFVAMSFHAELNTAFETGIEPALSSDCGYDVMRVDRAHPDGKIDDLVFAEIRRARLVIADLTLLRPNVIMEAGFALGLGIPVIWTCRAGDDFGRVQYELFDARQYAFLVWETPEQLRQLLRDRIRARFPLPT